MVKPYITMPRAEYLSEGQWVVATTNVLKFSILCETSNKLLGATRNVITVRPPIDIITLRMSCSSYSGYMTLPPFYHKESNYNVSSLLNSFVRNYNELQEKIWKPFRGIFPDIKRHTYLPS